MRLSASRRAGRRLRLVSVSSVLACVVACLQACSNGAAPAGPSPQVATITPDTVDASVSPLATSNVASAMPSGADAADAATTMTAVNPSDASGPDFGACTADTECVAVKKNACCNHGELEAVATSQQAAYKASFTCPPPRPKCPMFLRRDLRVAVCDSASQHCTMVPPEELACGTVAGAHACPTGFHCASGKCTK